MKEIWIIGIGLFGWHAVKTGGKHPHTRLILVDPVQKNLEQAKGPNRTLEVADGIDYTDRHLSSPEQGPDWIVPALPVHLAAEWCLRRQGPACGDLISRKRSILISRTPCTDRTEMSIPAMPRFSVPHTVQSRRIFVPSRRNLANRTCSTSSAFRAWRLSNPLLSEATSSDPASAGTAPLNYSPSKGASKRYAAGSC